MSKKISKRKLKKIMELDTIIKSLPEGRVRDAYNRALGMLASELLKAGE